MSYHCSVLLCFGSTKYIGVLAIGGDLVCRISLLIILNVAPNLLEGGWNTARVIEMEVAIPSFKQPLFHVPASAPRLV